MADLSKSDSMVRRFSGEGQDPQRDWKRWKRWARAYLTVQKARGVDESALGAMLFTLLDGAALRSFDSINMDEIEQVGGQDIIYQTLDERFPEEAAHDRIGEVMDGIFDLKVEKGVDSSSQAKCERHFWPRRPKASSSRRQLGATCCCVSPVSAVNAKLWSWQLRGSRTNRPMSQQLFAQPTQKVCTCDPTLM